MIPGFEDFPVLLDPMCPADRAYLLNDRMIVMHKPATIRQRWWWKPWTWLRHDITGEQQWDEYWAGTRKRIVWERTYGRLDETYPRH